MILALGGIIKEEIKMSKNYNRENNFKGYGREADVTVVDDINVSESKEESEMSIDVIGIISGCKRLNVREQPDMKSTVLRVIDENTEVTIAPAFENDEWYCVTVDDVSGYCMKKFIVVRES